MSTEPCYPETAPAIDDLLTTLSNQLRREVIYYFENHVDSSIAPLNTVVRHVDERVPEESYERIYRQLLHVHVPKLVSDGWLDHDERACRLRYHGHGRAAYLLEELCAVF